MTVSYNCPECKSVCYNAGADPEDEIIGETMDFGCEECGCDFEVTYTANDINITKHGEQYEH